MFAYIIRRLKSMKVRFWTDNGNIYAVKGSGPYPCVVSHMDTVHDIEEDFAIFKAGSRLAAFNRLTMQQVGIGGDDKVGVYICLRLLSEVDSVKAVFFRDEEVGCQGSALADMSFFDDCLYVVQPDRRGSSDLITSISGHDICSKDFIDDLRHISSKYGYEEAAGLTTDVWQLKKDGLKVSAINVSCGYYNPHTWHEYVDIEEVENAFQFIKEIFTNLKERYRHKIKYSYKIISRYCHVCGSVTNDYCKYCAKEKQDIFY
jgi:putative aminopeptidase FrvX